MQDLPATNTFWCLITPVFLMILSMTQKLLHAKQDFCSMVTQCLIGTAHWMHKDLFSTKTTLKSGFQTKPTPKDRLLNTKMHIGVQPNCCRQVKLLCLQTGSEVIMNKYKQDCCLTLQPKQTVSATTMMQTLQTWKAMQTY